MSTQRDATTAGSTGTTGTVAVMASGIPAGNFLPADPQTADQWHLLRLGNLQRIWDEYTGDGVKVGIYDDGVQFTHSDLNNNYDASNHVVIGPTTFSGANVGDNGHGTSVAGLIAAENNNAGTVGIAFDASITGVNIFDPASALYVDAPVPTGFYAAIAQSTRFDIVNNSWNTTGPGFTTADNVDIPGSFAAQTLAGWVNAAATGRGGLGTVVVKSAGNAGVDANHEGLSASRHTITVAAVGDAGFAASYSNHGADILVSAPGDETAGNGGLGIVATDLLGTQGSNLRADPGASSDYTDDFGGTSAAAAIVSGVAALMLEANPGLGWRDVQNILAASAHHVGSSLVDTVPGSFEDGTWQINKANNWNGGGMHVHANYGYGEVDAYNAVRMAEVWTLFGAAQTSANEASFSTSVNIGAPLAIVDNPATTTSFAWAANPNILIEHVSLTLTITHSRFTDLRIWLVSAEGTRVQVYDGSSGNDASADTPLTWTFGIDSLRGENANGTWTLQFQDAFAGEAGSLASSFTFKAFGTPLGTGDVFHFTDEFATLVALPGGTARRTITDTDGGIDWINAAAVSSASTINLNANTWSSIGGTSAKVTGANPIENVVTGDGNDLLIGNAANNRLLGMRGNDTMRGGAGNDEYTVDNALDLVTEAAGAGADTVISAGAYTLAAGSEVELLQTSDALAGTTLRLSGNEFAQTIIGNAGSNIILALAGNDTVLGGDGSDLMDGGQGKDVLNGEDGDDVLFGGSGGSGGNDDTLSGGEGDDTLAGGAGGDSLNGGNGRDRLSYDNAGGSVRVALDGTVTATGDAALDTLVGFEGLQGGLFNDSLVGDNAANELFGSDGADSLVGKNGDDTLDGGLLGDSMAGGNGNDLYIVDDLLDVVTETGSGVDTVLSAVSFVLTAANAVESLQTTDFGDTVAIDLIGNGFAQSIEGNEGANSLAGAGASDSLFGYGGDDAMDGGEGTDAIAGGEGNDLLRDSGLAAVAGTDDVLDGGAGDDTLIGGRNADSLVGGSGRDVASYEGAAGVRVALDGSLIFAGDAFGDTLVGIEDVWGSDGADTIAGNGSANLLDGRLAADDLRGQAGNDTLLGGLGDDTLNGGSGSDLIDGAEGDRDLASYDGAAGVRVALDGSLAFTGHAAGDTLIGIEGLLGSASADTLYGNNLANLLDGSASNDSLRGQAGDDSLAGGAGNDSMLGGDGADTLNGGAGKDALLGGAGNDLFVFSAASDTPATAGRDAITDWNTGDLLDFSSIDADIALGGTQTFVFRGTTANTSAAAAGELWTYQFNNVTYVIGGIDGDGLRDLQVEISGLRTINGLSFAGVASNLAGTAGADTLVGGQLGDSLSGAAGNDNLVGNDGADTLVGSTGRDTLNGGLGNDRFVYTSVTDSVPVAAERDVIAGFNAGDLIDLSAIDANTTIADDQAFVWRGYTATPTLAKAGDLWFHQFNGSTWVIAGVDGDGLRDLHIEISGLVVLSETSFIM